MYFLFWLLFTLGFISIICLAVGAVEAFFSTEKVYNFFQKMNNKIEDFLEGFHF